MREKWLFRPALSPAQMDEREASCPSELFTANPFKWDDADPQVQASGWNTATYPCVAYESLTPKDQAEGCNCTVLWCLPAL